MMDNRIKPLREQIMDKLIITKNKTDIIYSFDLYKLFGNTLPSIIANNVLSFPGVSSREILTGTHAGHSAFMGIKLKDNAEEEDIDILNNEINNKIIITNNINDLILASDINNMFKYYTPKTISNCFKDLEIEKNRIKGRGPYRDKICYIGIKLKEL
jgi:hypothetical protein